MYGILLEKQIKGFPFSNGIDIKYTRECVYSNEKLIPVAITPKASVGSVAVSNNGIVIVGTAMHAHQAYSSSRVIPSCRKLCYPSFSGFFRYNNRFLSDKAKLSKPRFTVSARKGTKASDRPMPVLPRSTPVTSPNKKCSFSRFKTVQFHKILRSVYLRLLYCVLACQIPL